MPKNYGYLMPLWEGGYNTSPETMALIRNQTWPGGSPIPEDEYWSKLMPDLQRMFPGVTPAQPQQFQAPPLPTGAVSVSPDQLQQMRDAQAAGGMYSLLNPSQNVSPAAATAGIADYVSKYTNPTAKTGLEYLKSLPGTMTTPNLPATPYVTPRPSTTPANPFRTAVRPSRGGRGGFGYIPRSTYGRF